MLPLTLLLAGCGDEPPNPSVTARELPQWPSFARKVYVQPARVGEDWRVVSKRYELGLDQANARIGKAEMWYEKGVREAYSK